MKAIKTFVVAMIAIGVVLVAMQPQSAKAADPLAVVEEMVAAWDAVDLDRVIDLFAEDGALHSVMIEPIVGRETLREHLSGLFAGTEYLKLNIKNVAVTGNTVIIERVDEFIYNGKKGSVPAVGVLEIEDGKVKVWREYYDRAMLFAELGVPMPGDETEGGD